MGAQSLPDHSRFKHAALVCTNFMKVSCEVATRDRFHLHSVRKLVSSAAFKSFIMCMILLNVILIAYITNSTVKYSFDNFHLRQMGSTVEHRVPLFLEEIDFAFCIIFTVEVALRIAAFEVLFFVGPDMSWNIFDLLVVSMSLANVVAGGSTSSPVLVRLLRLSRVGRTFRSVWILRTLPSLYKLRFMILAIINSLGALFWGSALIALVVYIWAVVLIMIVSQYLEGAQASDATISSLDEYFGSLPIALATLYMSITGGIDWEDSHRGRFALCGICSLLHPRGDECDREHLCQRRCSGPWFCTLFQRDQCPVRPLQEWRILIITGGAVRQRPQNAWTAHGDEASVDRFHRDFQ